MHVSSFILSLNRWDKPPAIRRTWNLSDGELSSIGKANLVEFSNNPLAERISWQGLAILEFAEVQDQTFPKAGPYFNINFFYFEACSVLREAFVAGLNGCIHASLAALRPVFEMFVLHRHWKEHRQNVETYEEFYKWFSGAEKAPGFGKVLTQCYVPHFPGCATVDDARALYAKLCSYVHKPSLAESITSIRGGNVPGVSRELLDYWIQVVHEVHSHGVELLVRASPASLFPIDITRKFGFNPPVGLFFDPESFRILEKALGKANAIEIRKAYETLGTPAEIEWAKARPNLTDARIFKSWRDQTTPSLEGKTKAEKIRHGRILLKAKMRVIAQSSAYMKDAPTMPDIRELLARLTEADSNQ